MKLCSFKNKAILIHGNKYKYLNIVDKYVEIECIKHGIFKQNISKHLNGRGCQKCGKERVLERISSSKIVEEEFVNKLINKFNNIVLDSNYIDYNTKTWFKCSEHGNFNKTPKQALISGCNKCSKISSLEYTKLDRENNFIRKAIEKYGNYYDYSKVKYRNMNTHVEIICKKHGIFYQTHANHLKHECTKCSKNTCSTKGERYSNFKRRFIELYKESNITLYDDIYVNDKTKINLYCDKHGLFKSLPSNVLKGTCCKKCGIERIVEFNTENTVGWSYTNWGNASTRSKNFDSFKVYILKFESDDEVFYKVGKTFRKTKVRIRDLRISNYDVEILSEFVFDTAKECSEYEQKLKNDNKINSYKPHIKFKGYTECFIKLNK